MTAVSPVLRGDSQTRRRLGWLLAVRLLVITLFLGGSIVYQLRSGLGSTPPVLPYLYLLIGFSYLHAVVSAFMLPVVNVRLFAQSQAMWDLLLATSLIYLTGGIDSLFSFLYLLIIVTVGVFLPRRDVLVAACASAILYGSLLDLQYYGYLPLLKGLSFPVRVGGRDVFYAVFVNVLAFFLVALLSGALSERLRRSQEALAQKAIDFQELETLNRAILVNINTGIMVVNALGRIRLFNEAASRMTGYALRELYNLDVRQVFPRLPLFDGDRLLSVPRGQGEFIDREGQEMVFGYASSPLPVEREEEPGLLVVFQDLTPFVEMEEKLRRSDRLAAVGRLAAGLAHEIRNPLASISGSVQLLMEEQHVTPEDRRLMGIVVREADRLSSLLSDFLLYARPAEPNREAFDPAGLLDDLLEMVARDERFGKITIAKDYSPGNLVYFDRQQLRQVLWDLLVNSAEGMGEGGILRIGLREQARILFVEDTGPGISPQMRPRIFEPFFTTKEAGTGLGLATVHALVLANGGSIDVGSGAEGGACFEIRFPEISPELMPPLDSSLAAAHLAPGDGAAR